MTKTEIITINSTPISSKKKNIVYFDAMENDCTYRNDIKDENTAREIMNLRKGDRVSLTVEQPAERLRIVKKIKLL